MGRQKTTTSPDWLRVLLCVELVSLLLTMTGLFAPGGTLIRWLTLGLNLATVYCLYRLSPLNSRLGRAAAFRLLSLCASFVHGTLLIAVTLAGTVCFWAAMYQVCTAFSELTEDCDGALARQWKNFFWWKLFSGLALGLAGGALAVALGMLMSVSAELSARIMSWASVVLNLVLDGIYVWLLLRTGRLLQMKN